MSSKVFNDIEDVWDVIWLLREETLMQQQEGRSVSIEGSISTQLPFFACKDNFTDMECLKVIRKYNYCKEFSISPYKNFNDTPNRWIISVNVIKSALEVIKRREYDKAKKKG